MAEQLANVSTNANLMAENHNFVPFRLPRGHIHSACSENGNSALVGLCYMAVIMVAALTHVFKAL